MQTKKKILIIEDQEDVRENIATYNNKTNQWLLKDGSQFIGGMCV